MDIAGVVIIGAMALAVVGILYMLYRDAKKAGALETTTAAQSDALHRVQNAIRSGDAVPSSPDRLRDNDGHRRD
jgi:type II secretory pathway pseudopilin PulG